MTLDDFNERPYPRQIAQVFVAGHFLARRWQTENEAVNLYEVPGPFFAELTYDLPSNSIIDVLAFDRSEGDRLEEYAVSVRLPDWVPGSE